MTVELVVVVVEVTSMGVITGLAWLLRRQVKSFCRSTISNLILQKEMKTDGGSGSDGGGEVESFDCIVCLCEVSPAEDHQKLPNCNHGAQFHAGCIDSWLKNHSTCPVCRSPVPRTVNQQLHGCLSVLWHDFVDYFDSALENVASSIGDCREF